MATPSEPPLKRARPDSDAQAGPAPEQEEERKPESENTQAKEQEQEQEQEREASLEQQPHEPKQQPEQRHGNPAPPDAWWKQANVKKRKVAVILGYVGFGFHGLQWNPGNQGKTIEFVLEAALARAKAIAPPNAGDLQKSAWARACRTDKGVHAQGNCITFKAMIDWDDAEIAVARGYPEGLAFAALRKQQQQEEEEEEKEQGGEPVQQQQQQQQQRGRKRKLVVPAENPLEFARDAAALRVLRERVNEELSGHDIRVFQVARVMGGFNCKNAVDFRIYEYLLPVRALAPVDVWQKDAGASYSLTEADRAEFERHLACFEGTRSYHNYTNGKRWGDSDAKRFMNELRVSDPLHLAGGEEEFVRVRIQGQSFLLHQIRRMIGMALIAFRYRNIVAQKNSKLASEGSVAAVAASAATAASDSAVPALGPSSGQADGEVASTREYETTETGAERVLNGTTGDETTVPATTIIPTPKSTSNLTTKSATDAEEPLDTANALLTTLGWKRAGFPMVPGEYLSLDFCAYNSYNRSLDQKKSNCVHLDQRAGDMLEQRRQFREEILYPKMAQCGAENNNKLLRDFFEVVDKFGVRWQEEDMPAEQFVVQFSKRPDFAAKPTHLERKKTTSEDWV